MSSRDDDEALEALRRELEALKRQSDQVTPSEPEPPIAELEALAGKLAQLRSQEEVPFDRDSTWEVIEEQIVSAEGPPGEDAPDC